MDILKEFEIHCTNYNISYQLHDNVKSYDDSTYFCPAGVQRLMPILEKVKDDDETSYPTEGYCQDCIRTNDLEELGDGTHAIHFKMLGLFSLTWSMKQTVEFWMSFMDKIGLKIDVIAVHPDKLDWINSLHLDYHDKVTFMIDPTCTWAIGDDELSYCTEFYYNGVEVGNIVNTYGKAIDVGFGFDRIDNIVNKRESESKTQLLINAVAKLLQEFKPGPKKAPYVVRKLIRRLIPLVDLEELKFSLPEAHMELIVKEDNRVKHMQKRFWELLDKNKDKDAAWWKGTHGIDLDEMKTIFIINH